MASHIRSIGPVLLWRFVFLKSLKKISSRSKSLRTKKHPKPSHALNLKRCRLHPHLYSRRFRNRASTIREPNQNRTPTVWEVSLMNNRTLNQTNRRSTPMNYKLTALTPLLVGDGRELSPIDYMVWKDQVNVLDQP